MRRVHQHNANRNVVKSSESILVDQLHHAKAGKEFRCGILYDGPATERNSRRYKGDKVQNMLATFPVTMMWLQQRCECAMSSAKRSRRALMVSDSLRSSANHGSVVQWVIMSDGSTKWVTYCRSRVDTSDPVTRN